MLRQSTKKRIGIAIVACVLALGISAPAALAAPNLAVLASQTKKRRL